MKTIGKIVFGEDNNSYMHLDNTLEEFCSNCGNRIEMRLNEEFILNKRNFDISYTYDGYLIVSEKLKEWLETSFDESLNFHHIRKDSNFYWLEVLNTLEFDVKKRKTKMIDKCSVCGNYAEVAGSTPGFICSPHKLDVPGIYRSDIFFGSLSNQFYLIMIDLRTASSMSLRKFKGISFADILN